MALSGDLGVILVLGGLAAVAMGALKKLNIEVESEFELGDYETEFEAEFEVDKLDKNEKRGKKRRGQDRPNPRDQPNQIDPEKPMLADGPEGIDMFPYYNKFILA